MKPLKIATLSIISTFLISQSAYADQCSYVEKEQGLKAISFLNLNQQIYLFCEPCGDKVPQAVMIESVGIGTVGYQDFWQVSVNGKGVDLAYTYVPSSLDRKPINLAALSGCSASDVSPFINF
ncbi:hypothetical protein VB715_17455 [Crocosphaera sp. UHCC 0190]|uniref:hypothetical protein n=1 Tax=Crocosphaera sp. UHCC 0190 TaxID=3110246 RepID=UPI002B1EEB23|nr:hypothetical protein [Crocosphaera sp. UHCC 0190]MEA5511563.1 hypothetical protein [Crocosphaera sp. UHCC 0190]